MHPACALWPGFGAANMAQLSLAGYVAHGNPGVQWRTQGGLGLDRRLLPLSLNSPGPVGTPRPLLGSRGTCSTGSKRHSAAGASTGPSFSRGRPLADLEVR